MPQIKSFQIDTVELGQDPDLVAGVSGNITLGGLSDVLLTGSVTGDVLTFDGTDWVNQDSTAGSVAWGSITGTLSTQIDLQTALDLKTNQSSLDAHTGDATIHFTETSIDHTNILNNGTNTHLQIDTHIADSSIHLTGSPPTLAATNISYDDTTTNLQGGDSPINDVQAAVEKLDLKRRFKNTTHTGIISGGRINSPTSTTINISDGNGAILNQVLNPGAATATQVAWTGLTGITLTQEPGGFGSTYIFINNIGTVTQFLTLPNTQVFIGNIYLGTVFYESGAITLVFNEPDVVDSTAVNFDDYVSFLGPNIKGVTPIAVGSGDPNSVLEFFITDGDYFGLGANWHNDRYNPNIIQISANGTDTTGAIPWGNGAVFDYILGDGTIFSAAQTTLDETVYDDGTSVPGNVPGGDGLIQFIIELPGGKTYVQPFTQTYRDWKAANSSLSNALSNFVKANEIKEGIIIGAYVGQQDTSNWERGDRSSIVGVAGGGNASGGNAGTYYIDLSVSANVVIDTALPTGWSTASTGTGIITITHNLGDAELGFALTVLHATIAHVVNPTTINVNDITFQITDMAGAPQDGNLLGKLLF